MDLRSNIAAEARAKIVYDRLINFTEDVGTQEALQFLMTREITHMRSFAAALESMEKPVYSIGTIAPTPGLVDEYFNASTGEGDLGKDYVGPWNEGNGLHIVNSKKEGGEGPDHQAVQAAAGDREDVAARFNSGGREFAPAGQSGLKDHSCGQTGREDRCSRPLFLRMTIRLPVGL